MNTVAWNRQHITEGMSSGSLYAFLYINKYSSFWCGYQFISYVVSFVFTASTREVVLGTENGQLHEIVVDEKDKKEKHINLLYELKELPEAFTSLQVHPNHLTTSGHLLLFS